MPHPPAGQALLDAFGQIVIINLTERADRRRAMARELAPLGLSLDHPQVHVFAAHRPDSDAGFPSIGARGAFQSHRGVMARMLDQNWPRMLVLEDDMALAPDATNRLPALAHALADRPWDLLYGHPGDQPQKTPAADSDGLITLPPELGLIQLHFLGVTQRAAQIIAPQLDAMRARPPGSPQGGPMHVDGALNWIRRGDPSLIALATDPAMALQRASRSDIAGPRWFDRLPGLSPLITLARHLRG